MKKYNVDEARTIAMSCAKQYQRYLQDQKFLIIYRDRNSNVLNYLEVLFLDRNFQHLTGLMLIDSSGNVLDHHSVDFFRKCIKNKLRKDEIAFKKDGTTHLKLAALSSLTKIHSITKITGDYNGDKPYLYADKVIGGVNFCMGLIKENDIYSPATALLEDIKKVTANPSQVITIMSKDKGELIYKNIRHVAKGVNLNNIVFPAELASLLCLEEYTPTERAK